MMNILENEQRSKVTFPSQHFCSALLNCLMRPRVMFTIVVCVVQEETYHPKKADVDDRLCSCNAGRNSTSKKGDVDDRCWCDPDRNVTSKKEISTSVFIILLFITFMPPI